MGAKMRKNEIIILGIILASFIIGIYFYPQMPDEMAFHWNSQGQVDGCMSKFWELFLMPFILVPVILVATYTIIYSYFEYRKAVK